MSGKFIAGAMIFEFFSPGISKILSNAGSEFVIYDMEHTGLQFETLKWLLATCRGLPLEPMVRVPTGNYTYMARALDLGARGLMIPMVEDKNQAENIVESCRYPLKGRRGAAFGFAQCDYQNQAVKPKINTYNRRNLIIAQIETEKGLKNIDQIASVEGIDVLWVGHFDLSNFLGIPGEFDNPVFTNAMKKVAISARNFGKIAGFMASDQAWIEKVTPMGYTMIACGPDTAILEEAFQLNINKIISKNNLV